MFGELGEGGEVEVGWLVGVELLVGSGEWGVEGSY